MADTAEMTARRRHRLAIEIGIVIVAKIIALAMIWAMWFSGDVRRPVTQDGVAATIFSAPAPHAAGQRRDASRP